MSDKLRLISGDASTVLDRLIQEGIEVDMIYTSPNPPFYTRDNADERELTMKENLGRESNFSDYVNNLMKVFEKARAILKNDGSFWLHAGDYSLYPQGRMNVPHRIALHMMDKWGWFLNSELIWFRPEKYKSPKRIRFKKDYENIFFFSKIDKPKIYDDRYLETSIINAPYIKPVGEWNSGFPEELVHVPIMTCTCPTETVLDMFMGTGVTGKVALQMGRKFIGIELFPWKTQKTLERLRAI